MSSIGDTIASQGALAKYLITSLLIGFASIGIASSTLAEGNSFSSIYEKDRPSVVYIVSALPNGAASGSGFIYSSTGSSSTVITANHVVEGASRVDVILDSDSRHRYHATILKRDHVRDVAILTIPIGNRRALPLMDPKDIHEGSDMAVIGYPRAAKTFEEQFGDALRPTVHVGIVSAVRLNGEIIQFDAPTDHGDSGGPVIDRATGAVMAIVTGALLDTHYSSRGIEQALPGSNYGMSVATIEQVMNEAPPASSEGAPASLASSTPSNSAGPGRVATTGGPSSAAFRVGYGAPHYTNAEVESDSQLVLQRLANYFAAGNAFYMIPVQFGTASEEGQKLSGLCDDNRLNAIVQPGVFWSFPRVFIATGAPASVEVKVTLTVTDCSGGAFFYDVKTKTEDRRFSHRTVDRQIIDVANDLLDQTLHDFETFRANHDGAWNSLLKTGIPVDPNDGRYHSLFSYNQSFHVYAVFTGGPAAKAGLLVGDQIQALNGEPIAGMSVERLGQMFNSPKLEVLVDRPGGPVTITVLPQKYDQLLSLSR